MLQFSAKTGSQRMGGTLFPIYEGLTGAAVLLASQVPHSGSAAEGAETEQREILNGHCDNFFLKFISNNQQVLQVFVFRDFCKLWHLCISPTQKNAHLQFSISICFSEVEIVNFDSQTAMQKRKHCNNCKAAIK